MHDFAQVRSVEAQKAALAHRVEVLTTHVGSLNKELQTMTSRCVSLEQGRHGEGENRGGEEDEVSRLRAELETFKEACRHSVPLSEFDAFKAAADLAQERLKTTAQESAEREAGKYAENIESLRRACKEEERACRAERDAIIAQCEARAEVERESHSALVAALEGEIETLRESKKACARCAGSDQSLSAEKQRREAVEEELAAANERCQRLMSNTEEVGGWGSSFVGFRFFGCCPRRRLGVQREQFFSHPVSRLNIMPDSVDSQTRESVDISSLDSLDCPTKLHYSCRFARQQLWPRRRPPLSVQGARTL